MTKHQEEFETPFKQNTDLAFHTGCKKNTQHFLWQLLALVFQMLWTAINLIVPAITDCTILQKHNPRLKIVCILKGWGPVWLSAFPQMMLAQQSDLLWPDISYFWKNGDRQERKGWKKKKEEVLGFLSELNTKPQQTPKCNDCLITLLQKLWVRFLRKRTLLPQRYPFAIDASNKGHFLVSPLPYQLHRNYALISKH